MGIVGTQVARQSAAIILLDDKFNSIVKAVMWGRNIYDCIRKFIQFQLTVNVDAVTITLVGAALIKQQILKLIQMLWVNLIMDTLGPLALATEPPTEDLLDRPPHSRDEYIISKKMFKHIIGQAIFQIIVTMVLVFAGEKFIPEYEDSYDSGIFKLHPEYKWRDGIIGGTVRSGRMKTVSGAPDYEIVYDQYRIFSRHFTFVFNTFVMMQVFNFVNCKKLHEQLNVFQGISRNAIFLVIIGSIIVLQFLLVTLTEMAFGVYANFGLSIQQWGLCILIGSFSLVVSIILKLLPIAKNQYQHPEHGYGNKKADVRRGSRIISLKRIEQRVDRDLAKNHVLS